MLDVQSRQDSRGIALAEAGIAALKFPALFELEPGATQATVATARVSVALPASDKGTHMSRFVELVSEPDLVFSVSSNAALAERVRERLAAHTAEVEIEAPVFNRRAAPVTGALGPIDYVCGFRCRLGAPGDLHEITVRVPVTTLCPCSKEISDYGAHNQRGTIHLNATVASPAAHPSVQALITLAEACGSAPLYSVLKRPDERHVTMQAYDQPKFVEDVARDVAARLIEDRRIQSFDVRVVNDESIHNHQAYARAVWAR